MAEPQQQIWNGNIEITADRNRHKVDVDTFTSGCASRRTVFTDIASQGSGIHTLKVKHTHPEAEFNIIYQDLRSGDRYEDDRKRLQVSSLRLKVNEQYFYVSGYNAGDKYIMIAFLTQTREINDSYRRSSSSRWIDWEPFEKTYRDGVHLWCKNGVVYLGCTSDNADLFWNALATRSLDGYVPTYVATTGIAKTTQKILFGAPGTGKSHKVKEETHGLLVHRTTFHPDTDYASFVGTYKPAMDGTKIVYRFVPQVFAKAYCKAWNEYLKPSAEKVGVCLLIEELNRGNCAQIFGDIFQILDRKKETGFSEYSIEADQELATYLRSEISDWEKYYNTIREHSDLNEEGAPSIIPWDAEGENQVLLCLPPNMSIVCTMNTSDQSLFPMDSAFKRRWEWEYVPIQYNLEKSDFRIVIDQSHEYSWRCFLQKLNDIIYEQTRSEDKQMGNFFVKGDENMEVDCDQFVSKVMYFLWSEICKDNPKAKKAIFVTETALTPDNGTPVTEEFTFSRLFPDDGHPRAKNEILYGFFKYHCIENISDEIERLDPTETAGEGNKERWEHSIYSDELIEYIINAGTAGTEPFKRFINLFGTSHKTHGNGFAFKIGENRWISLSRNKDANLVCFGSSDHAKMRDIMKEHGAEIAKELKIPNVESNRRSESRWMFTDKQGQAKIASAHSLNKESEYLWFVENALKMYDKFTEYFS